MFNNNFKFWAADDSKGGTLSTEDIVDILNDESGDENEEDEIKIGDKGTRADKSDKKEGKDKEEAEEDKGGRDKTDKQSDDKSDSKSEGEGDGEGDEYDELEEELEDGEKDEDELELITPVRRKEILAKFPTIFKEFPYLEKAYYREQKFSEYFPSLDDARAAQEDSQVLRSFEKQLYNGDISEVITELKKENVESFHRLVDNYLPTLQKIDQQAFFNVINSVVKPIIYNMVQTGTSSQDDELIAAARKLNQFFYGSAKWEPHQPLAKGKSEPEDKESEKIKAERQELFTERFTEASGKLTERVDTSFRKVIEKNIDPKGDMSDYVKKTAIRDAHESLTELLGKDVRFRGILDKAWRQAGEKNFSPDAMEKIRRIINARAQTVLPSVIKKARNEALRGIGKRVRVDKDNDDDSSDNTGRSASSPNRGPLRQSSSQSGKSGKTTEIPKGMSNKDFIMQD